MTLEEFREKSKYLFERNQLLCSKLNRSQKFYYFSAISALAMCFWWISPFEKLFHTTLSLVIFFAGCGVVSDLLIIFDKVWNTKIGKAAILLSYTATTNLAYASASQIVNEIVKFETSKLVYTTNIVVFLLLPVFLVGVTYILFGILLIVSQFYLLSLAWFSSFKDSECFKAMYPEDIEHRPLVTFLVRFFTFSSIIGITWGVSTAAMPAYENFILSTTKSFIYNFEARKYSRCETDDNVKVIELSDKEILVVEKISSGYRFTPKICTPKLKPNEEISRIK